MVQNPCCSSIVVAVCVFPSPPAYAHAFVCVVCSTPPYSQDTIHSACVTLHPSRPKLSSPMQTDMIIKKQYSAIQMLSNYPVRMMIRRQGSLDCQTVLQALIPWSCGRACVRGGAVHQVQGVQDLPGSPAESAAHPASHQSPLHSHQAPEGTCRWVP